MAETNEQTTAKIGGMIGGTYFANSPVVVNIWDLQFNPNSSMRVVKVWVETSWKAEEPTTPTQEEIDAVQRKAAAEMTSRFGAAVTNDVLLGRATVAQQKVTASWPILSGKDVISVGMVIRLSNGSSYPLYASFATKNVNQETISKNTIEEWMTTNLADLPLLDAIDALFASNLAPWCIFATPQQNLLAANIGRLFVLQRQYYVDAYTPPSAGDDEDLDTTDVIPFFAEVGNDTSMDFDISTGLRAMWDNYTFGDELRAAQDAATGILDTAQVADRACLVYKVRANTEWIDKDGTPHEGSSYASSEESYGLLGGWTEVERFTGEGQPNIESLIGYIGGRAAVLASTKPTDSPEIIGVNSIVSEGMITYQDSETAGSPVIHRQIFHPVKEDGFNVATFSVNGHTYVRDAGRDFVDFLFINSRGAMESCSATMKESLSINISSQVHAHVERPSFVPTRSLMAINSGGRRSWSMSSGYQTREWAEWWTMEFLRSSHHWMLIDGRYFPVTVEASKSDVPIYDRTKQELPHVDFTVKLALEG